MIFSSYEILSLFAMFRHHIGGADLTSELKIDQNQRVSCRAYRKVEEREVVSDSQGLITSKSGQSPINSLIRTATNDRGAWRNTSLFSAATYPDDESRGMSVIFNTFCHVLSTTCILIHSRSLVIKRLLFLFSS